MCPALRPELAETNTWRLTRGPSYEGFGRRPFALAVVGDRGRRSKASQGGNRGERRRFAGRALDRRLDRPLLLARPARLLKEHAR
jgi:hypothetical protein